MGRTVRSCSTRSSFTCSGKGSSPISSRKRVPPSASAKRPSRARSAPVNAPFSWPNSSDSRRFSGIAPQFTATKGSLTRGEERWSARAIASFPVPLSPVIRTLVGYGATRDAS